MGAAGEGGAEGNCLLDTVAGAALGGGVVGLEFRGFGERGGPGMAVGRELDWDGAAGLSGGGEERTLPRISGPTGGRRNGGVSEFIWSVRPLVVAASARRGRLEFGGVGAELGAAADGGITEGESVAIGAVATTVFGAGLRTSCVPASPRRSGRTPGWAGGAGGTCATGAEGREAVAVVAGASDPVVRLFGAVRENARGGVVKFGRALGGGGITAGP